MYKKYATDNSQFVEKSCMYNFQMLLMVLVPLLTIVRFIVRAVYFEQKTIYGFMVSSLIFLLIFINYFSFLDFVFSLYPFFIFVCNHPNCEREILQTTLSTSTRPWSDFAHIFHIGVLSTKPRNHEFE